MAVPNPNDYRSLWDVPSAVSKGVATVGIQVRYPDGKVIPMGVPRGTTGREYAKIIGAEPGYTVTAVVVLDDEGQRRTARK